MDYYEILGIKKTANDDDIKKAYRKLALKFHPDKAKPEDKESHEEKFKKISDAYSVLSDPEKMKNYDMFGKDSSSGNGGNDFHFSAGGIDPDELFRQMFGGEFFQGDSPFVHMHHTQRQQKGKLIVRELSVTLEEIFSGAVRKLKIPNEHNTPEIIEVKIPQSVDDKLGYVCRNKVYAGENVIPSDMKVIVTRKDHPIFTRDDNDLHMKLNIMVNEAMDGITRELKMIDGDYYVLNIKKLKESDYVHIIPNRGMYVPGTNRRGSLYIHFNVRFT